MPLAPGARLGPYEIVAAIGAGGMGEVYRARDSKLGRDVAIKVLPSSLTGDPDRLARFEREAKVLASLNHPHIAAIYHVEDTGDGPGLVMELVEGETLADRIARGSIPLDEALPIAKQIAEALEAAHEQGIIHRDLKPANIKVRPDGTVKVLDFGLAKLAEPGSGIGDPGSGGATGALSMSPTLTSPAMTGVGVLMGTAAYMSPEQAKGRAADKRSDIWAFGCVLFEMLTGERAFGGSDVPEVLASILAREPDWARLPSAVSPALLVTLKRCLHRDVKQRVPDISVMRLALDGAFDAAAQSTASSEPQGRLRTAVPWIVAAVSVLAAGLLIGPALRAVRVTPPPEMRLDVVTPATIDRVSFALSPDGRQIVFVASGESGVPRLWLRSLNSTSAQPLVGTDGAAYPFWAPDSRSIAFFAGGQLRRIDINSGPPRTLAPAAANRGGTWNADGTILFSTTVAGALSRVASDGGEVLPATTLDRQATHRFPHFLPDGRHFLFFATGTPETGGIYLGELGSTETHRLVASNAAGIYVAPGWVVWVRDGPLVAQRLDVARATLTGDPVILADPVIANTNGASAVSASMTGLLAYRTGETASFLTTLQWVDRAGTPIGTVAGPNQYGNIALSPDGTQIAFDRQAQGISVLAPDVWLLDGRRHVESRFTFSPGVDNVPVFSPDGRTVAFAMSGVSGQGLLDIGQRPSNASGPAGMLVTLNARPIMFPSDWSSDGRFLALFRFDPKTQLDVWVVPMMGDRKPMPLLQSDFNESQPQFSPDGRWLAYVSDESGTPQVYVQSFPSLSGRWQVTSAGGTQPRWARDGRELFYLAAGKLMSVAVKAGNGLEIESPRPLFDATINPAAQRQQYAVSADGMRFLLNMPADTELSPLTIVSNPAALADR